MTARAIIHDQIGSVEITIDTAATEAKLRRAQGLLTAQVVADMDPLVPFRQGALRGSVRYPEGLEGGVIEYATPYAHYQYMGMVYGPNIPIKDKEGNLIGWWSPPEKYPTGRPIEYHTPGTGPEWFEEAKARHLHDWIRLCENAMK